MEFPRPAPIHTVQPFKDMEKWRGGGRSGPIRDGIVPSPIPPHQELEHYPRPVPEFQLGKTKLFYLAVYEDKLPPA